MNTPAFSRFACGVAALLLGFSTLALAGPPLVCHPIAIGQAKSLPPLDPNYRKGSNGYDVSNLTRDTLAILDSTPSVLVRMETLRRATIYAGRNPQEAKELLTRLHVRAESAPSTSIGALAWFDLGYLTAAFKQWTIDGESNPASGLEAYTLIQKAISLRGPDPEMDFGAALVTLSGPAHEHNDHVQRAIAGAKTDTLLAENLAAFNVYTAAR